MVDVVANHMGFAGPPANVKYENFVPFNSSSSYHPYCAIDYNDASTVQKCWMGDTVVSLPDLRTEDTAVQNGLNQWISQLVQNYSIDGLRLDSAMQTSQDFWPGFVSASGVYAVGEVLNGNPNDLCAWQNYMPGVLNYATYFWMLRAFQSTTGTVTELANNIQWLNSTCKDITLLGNFLENHDNPRWPSYTTDVGLTKNAIAFTVLNDGIPIIYYGQEQGFSGKVDPYNREPLWTSGYNTKSILYTFVGSLNAARKLAISKDAKYASSKSTVWYQDSQTFVTRKGASGNALISLFTNRGTGSSGSITLAAAKTGIAANTKYTDLLNCDTFTSDASGNLVIKISNGQPRALFRSSGLSGSDVCAYTNTGGVSTSAGPTKMVTSTVAQSSSSTVKSATGNQASSSSTTSACAATATANVSLQANITTAWGESAYVVGSISQLGSWDASKALALSSAAYTTSNPIWSTTLKLPGGTYFEYKFIKRTSAGGTVWENGSNRVYTAPKSCGNSVRVVLKGNWQA